MNTITFPLINLELQISRIAFSIGNIDIYWYAILMAFAFLSAIIIFKINDGRFQIKFNDLLDLSIFVIPISIICARLYYVLFNIKYYLINPIEIFNLRGGGLAIYGGIIGGFITCYVFCKKRKINILDLLDYIVPCLALRTINRKMGEFYKPRSIWRKNKSSLENGNLGSGRICRSSSNIFIRGNSNFFYI